MFSLDGRVALVTGGAQGIGLAIAQALAGQGARTAILDLDSEAARRAAAALGAAALGVAADVSHRDAFAAAVDAVLVWAGRLDVLINNAAVISTRPLLELGDAEWDRTLNVNLKSVFIGCQLVAPVMMRQGRGRIINISSIAAKHGGGLLGTAAYAAAKAGVIGFSKTIARELAPHAVTVNVIAPGPITTPMTAVLEGDMGERIRKMIPLGRFGQPSDIAAAAVYLASDEAAFVTGEVMDVNGGLLMD